MVQVENSGGIHACLFLLVYSMSPTFMLGIWHRDGWLKADWAQPIQGRVERGSPISDQFIAFINEIFIPFVFMCNYIDVYVDFMDDIFMVFILLLCWLYVCFMTISMYGYQHAFTCK